MKLPIFDNIQAAFTGQRIALPQKMRSLDVEAKIQRPSPSITEAPYAEVIEFSIKLKQRQTIINFGRGETSSHYYRNFERALAAYIYGPVIDELQAILVDMTANLYGEPEEVIRLERLIGQLRTGNNQD